jgi:hypothetical protein
VVGPLIDATETSFASHPSGRWTITRPALSFPALSFPALSFHKSAEKIPVALALALYAAMLAYVIPRHEPWADEAQAWELGKSLSLRDLFGTYIHYEGSPGLWHALLWLLARMHVTYSGMHWIVALIALAGMALLTIAAPFPLPLRLLLPFTYFFAFQYAVVARSYVLFPAILFGLACLWQRKRERPLPVVLLIGLLANVSVHGLAVALGLALVLALDWYRLPKTERAPWRHFLGYALLLMAMMAFAAWCIMPAPDAGWVVTAKRTTAPAVVDQSFYAHPWMLALPFRLKVFIAAIFQTVHALDHGLAIRFRLGIVVWALLIWGWVREGLLRYTLPILGLALVSRTDFQFYHAGLAWVLFLFLWWVTWPECERERSQPGPRAAQWRRKALFASVLVCVAFHLKWAISAVRYDASMPYSPDRDGANIIHAYLNRGDKVDVAVFSKQQTDGFGEYLVTGIEPYFATQPISNMPFRFWFWGGDEGTRAKYLLDSSSHNAVVVVEETALDTRYPLEEKRLEQIGYRREKVVCGQVFYPDMSSRPACHAFYEPTIP